MRRKLSWLPCGVVTAFFPWAPGGCPASSLQCDYARVRGVGDSVLNIYFGIYKYVNFFFFFCMGFSYSTHHLLSGEAGTAVHSRCSLRSFQHLLLREAETGVAGPGPPLRLSAAGAEGRGWSLGSQSPWPRWGAWRLPEVLGLFLRSVPHWALLAHRMFWSWSFRVVQSCFFWLGYYSPVISFLSLVSSRFLIKHSFS